MRKEAHCLASVEKEEGCSKTTLVCWSTLSVSRNPDQLSFPASQDVDGVSCLTFRPFVDLSFDDRPQKKNGVIKAEFVKSGANARRLFVRAVSTCKEIVGVGERERVRMKVREERERE